MDVYTEIAVKRAERYERRQARLEREARRERILGPIKFGLQVVLGTALLYLYLFFGCLWASM